MSYHYLPRGSSQEMSVDFPDDQQEDFYGNHEKRSPTPPLDYDLVGPDWNHKESFYKQNDPNLIPIEVNHRIPDKGQFVQPPRMKMDPMPRMERSSRVSLADTVDVFVDNQYLNTHNLNYGPVVIRIDDNHSQDQLTWSPYKDTWHNLPNDSRTSYAYQQGSSSAGSRSTASWNSSRRESSASSNGSSIVII